MVEKVDLNCQVHNYDRQEESLKGKVRQINQASLSASKVVINANP